MKSFLQFWEAMKKNELARNVKSPKNKNEDDTKYRAWDESKPKITHGKKFE